MSLRTAVAGAGLALLALANPAPAQPEGASAAAPTSTPADSIAASYEYLSRVMDQYHRDFGVYEDVSSPGNHFHMYAKIPEGAPVEINGSWTATRHSGATSMRMELLPTGSSGGVYFLVGVLRLPYRTPQPNFGTYPNAGYNHLDGDLTKLKFWARGETGGEKIDFFTAGVGRDPVTGNPTEPHPDSSKRHPPLGSVFTLTTEWTEYEIDVSMLNLSYLLGGFGWFADHTLNPNGAVFYLDDIRYELTPAGLAERLEERRVLRSYTTLPVQELPPPVGQFDLALRNVAFTYDNALALLAFLAHGSADGLRRARLIGDAFVYAAAHDRTYNGDRLRSAYAAGDLKLPPGWEPKGRPDTVVIPGFWDEAQQRFFEVNQSDIDTGNNAWAVLALLTLYKETGHEPYFNTAATIADGFLRSQRHTTGTYQGFLGGIDDPERPTRRQRPWASSEHNLDVFAALARLQAHSDDPSWLADALHARAFVDDMWDTGSGCYLPGTLNDETRNQNYGQLALDVQTWSVLALTSPRLHDAEALACAEQHHAVQADGFSGFDFNTDRDGVWFEGTAQMATAYHYAGRPQHAAPYLAELRRAQGLPGPPTDLGTPAASRDGLTTGFGFFYHRRLHIGATSWNLFAQAGFNPYGTEPALPPAPSAHNTSETTSLDK